MPILSSFVGTLKSAAQNKTNTIEVKYNKRVIKLCKILEELGYIYGFTVLDKHYLKVHLKFYENKSVLRNLKFVSKPSMRVYFRKKHLKGYNVLSFIKTNSFLILHTSKNRGEFLTDVECFMLGIGGEPAFVVS